VFRQGEKQMAILKDYKAFDGYYFQSGSIRNALEYTGAKAPHTGKPYSEALLFGVSGGMAFGYFYFHYEGYDPHVNILTRNTFNLFEPIMERLGIPYEPKQTTNEEKGRKNLIDALENGDAPIVIADIFSLPYVGLKFDENYWGMMPMVVYGYENGVAYIADRARVGLSVPAEDLDKARARVKKDKFSIFTLGSPNEAKLQSAVTIGIWDCIKLFTENPPKGSKNNFGFAAYEHWQTILSRSGNKASWSKTLPRGRQLFTGLLSAFNFSQLFGKDESRSAERLMMADFLDEAAVILNKPALKGIRPQLEKAGEAWCKLGETLLPDNVPMLKEARDLDIKKHSLFLNKGADSLAERQAIESRLDDLKAASVDFPLSEKGVEELQGQIAAQVKDVSAIEQVVIQMMREAMS
jgi:hypothetical protein